MRLKEWFKEITKYDAVEKFIQNIEGSNDSEKKEHREEFRIFTQDHIYSISAVEREDGGYLGCTVVTRKPRAGEDWNRGNDLADGKLDYNTWCKIKDDILGYELVPLNAQQTPMEDKVKEKKKHKDFDLSEQHCA